MDKAALRAYIREKKRAMCEPEIAAKSAMLGTLLRQSEMYRRAKSVYGYLSYNQEVRTAPILAQAMADGKRVAVPKCCGREMRFIWLDDLRRIHRSGAGVPEPADAGPAADDPTALVLMPGLAFDREGNRVGYGGGYYDRFLAREPRHPTVGLCYDFQLLTHLEPDEFDIPADAVLWA